MRQFKRTLVLFVLGGCMYVLIELWWRGFSHVSMFVLGGGCFSLIGLLNEPCSDCRGLLPQALAGALLITLGELITGLVVNCWLGLDVWDYSGLPFDLWGQICLPYSLLWLLLAAVAIVLDDYLRSRLFGERMPRYRLV